MPTQTPILKSNTYARPIEQSAGSADLDTIKLLIVAAALAVLACILAVGISTTICTYFSPSMM
ncbi:MAG TPA: hypothetical protein V6C89_06650 [Drouetiella sp.]|jgi:hypothetical protein